MNNSCFISSGVLFYRIRCQRCAQCF